jgi:hypothetical protein
MKHIFSVTLFIVIVLLFTAPTLSLAAGDTLVVYAKGPTLDKVIMGDTLANGTKAHHVYLLVSTDTTYLFDATITTNSNIAVIGVPNATTGRPPCIQPDVLGDGSIPGLLFTLSGPNTNGTFKNLYLLGIAINNSVNYGGGQAIQISADGIRLVADKVIFEQWSQFAIGYSANMDKFIITNCKFRNMTTQPTQYYVGEVLRNENYIGAFKTDSTVLRGNTMLCVSGYATAATGGMVTYYEFSHNNVVYTFKNLFFLDRIVNAKFDNNIFYGVYSGGQNKAEFSGGWDSFTAGTVASIITMGPLDSTTAAAFDPADIGNPNLIALAGAKRKVEVKNNAYFWPAALTSYWKSWDDTSHVDSIYTPVFMNSQSVGMFSSSATPGFVQSGNQNTDPGFGASIPNVLTQSTNGLLNWFKAVRTGVGTTQLYGYQITQVGTAANWTPPWPLPEATDMKYTNATLKASSTDGTPLGDPNWFGIATEVKKDPGLLPQQFSLSAAYPNPFNPSTNIQYTLNSSGLTSLKVYNVLGQLVKSVVNDVFQNAGAYKVTVDMSNLPSGLYVYILEQGNNRLAQKMMLLK